jgi:predicted dehydrogenase
VKFGVAVLGATGFIGVPYRREIRESSDDATIVALCGRRRDLLDAASREDRAAASEDRAPLATTDWRQAIEHPGVDLVLVCTPDACHREAVLACAALGKHVVCEKPVGLDARQAHEMWQAIRRARVAHYVPFWTRYAPAVVRAREIVRAGTLGDVRVVVYRWHNPRPSNMPFTWRDDARVSSAGSVADVGSHAYDTIRFLLGAEATRVLAHGATISPAKPDLGEVNLAEALAWSQAPGNLPRGERMATSPDYASLAFELDNGAVGTLVLSHAPEIELHGTEASLAVDRVASTIALVRSGDDRSVVEEAPTAGPVNRFARFVFPALRERIAGQPTEHPGLDDGAQAQLFTDAALRSIRGGGWTNLADVAAWAEEATESPLINASSTRRPH